MAVRSIKGKEAREVVPPTNTMQMDLAPHPYVKHNTLAECIIGSESVGPILVDSDADCMFAACAKKTQKIHMRCECF